MKKNHRYSSVANGDTHVIVQAETRPALPAYFTQRAFQLV